MGCFPMGSTPLSRHLLGMSTWGDAKAHCLSKAALEQSPKNTAIGKAKRGKHDALMG